MRSILAGALVLAALGPIRRGSGQDAFLGRLPSEPTTQLRLDNPKQFLAELRRSKVVRVFDDDVVSYLAERLPGSPVWEQFRSSFTPMRDPELAPLFAKVWEVVSRSEGQLCAAGGGVEFETDVGELGWTLLAVDVEEEGSEELRSTVLELCRRGGFEQVEGSVEFDGKRRALMHRGKKQQLEPFVSGGKLWLIWGTRLAERLAQRPAEPVRGLLAGRTEQLVMTMDAGALVRSALAAGAARYPKALTPLVEAMKVGEFGRFTCSLAARDNHLVLGLDLGLPKAGLARDLLSGLFPVEADARALLPRMLRDFRFACIWTIDAGRLWNAGIEATRLRMDPDGVAGVDLKDQLKRQLGFDLETDLVDQLDGGILDVQVFWPDAVEGSKDDRQVGPRQRILNIGVRDPKAVLATIDRELRRRGLHAARKSEEYGDVTIQRLPFLPGAELCYAVAGKRLLVEFGGRSGRLVRAMIDREAGLGEAGGGWQPGEALAGQLALLPGPPGMLLFLDMPGVLEDMSELLVPGLGMRPRDQEDDEEREQLEEVTTRVCDLIRKQGIRNSIFTAGTNDTGLWFRMIW